MRPGHPDHAGLLAELRKAGRPPSREPGTDSYGSSGHVYYFVSVPMRRALARSWLAAHRSAPPADVLALIESLLHGESHEEKTLAEILLSYHEGARRLAGSKHVERWLDQLNGWAEVDGLCQSTFSPEELLEDWVKWRALIRRLARDEAVHKRRAALVLLTGPVRRSSDARLAELALETIDRLQTERDILITKAVSWLLRSLATQHRETVARYLVENESTLPSIALRETRTKLSTGRKTRKVAREGR